MQVQLYVIFVKLREKRQGYDHARIHRAIYHIIELVRCGIVGGRWRLETPDRMNDSHPSTSFQSQLRRVSPRNFVQNDMWGQLTYLREIMIHHSYLSPFLEADNSK